MFPATANPTAKILGFHDDAQLPIKSGDTVTIPKGTRITSMGKVKELTAGRDRKVKVNHLLPGRSFCIGYVTCGTGERRVAGMSRQDVELVQRIYGAKPEDLLNHANVTMREDGRAIYLPIENPTVRWPGAGGYWSEVDINDVVFTPAATQDLAPAAQ